MTRTRAFAALAGVGMLAACAAQSAAAVQPAAPGFLLGLWHGFIFPIAWLISLFASDVAIYAVPNNGGWYDFGYFLGIVVFGVGARKSTRIVYRDRVIREKPVRRQPSHRGRRSMSALTLGHALLLGALLAALHGLWQLSVWLRSRDYGRGTPQYAQGRDGKRYAIWSFAVAVLLAALCLTPLCTVPLGSGS